MIIINLHKPTRYYVAKSHTRKFLIKTTDII